MSALLDHRIPPPAVGLLTAGAMWWTAQHLPGTAPNPLLAVAAALAALAGIFLLVAGVVSFRLARTTVNPLKPQSASSLVTSGIYRITRNPMYVGFTLLLLAWAAWLASTVALLWVPAFGLYIDRFQIVPEERALVALFGSAFEDYAGQVRRWL